jgi:hypothetical protein
MRTTSPYPASVRLLVRFLALFVAVAAIAASAWMYHQRTAAILDDFEDGFRFFEWRFEAGLPGEGAQGGYARTRRAAHSGRWGAEIAFDFTRGGRYVQITLPTRARGHMGGVSFWVRASAGVLLAVRMRDRGDQVFQREIGLAPREWTQVHVPFADWTDSWGGRGDGIVRGTPQAIALVAANTAPQRTGYVWVDDVRRLPEQPARTRSYAVLPPHPRLMLSQTELDRRRITVRTTPWLAALLERHRAEVRSAAVNLTIPRGVGQCEHWYACPEHGAPLSMEGPTRHVCPVDGRVYTGWPYDQVWITKQHKRLSRLARQAAVVYALSGDRVALRVARTIVTGYARRYRSYPLHDIHNKPGRGGKVLSQSLDDAAWLVPILQAADLIWSEMPEAERRAVIEDLARPAVNEVLRPARLRFHNIQCWHDAAIGLTGFLSGDEDLIAEALDGTRGMEAQVRNMVDQDGQWSEGSWGYHFYALDALTTLAQAARVCGRDLFSTLLRPMFTAPIEAAMPDGMLPRFNDDTGIGLGRADVYEAAFALLQDPKLAVPLRRGARDTYRTLLYGAPALPPADPEQLGPRLMHDSGYAVLAPPHDSTAWACLKFGRHGGDHGHLDKNGLVTYGAGSVLFDDAGVGPYLTELADGWYAATVAHNTVAADQQNQRPATGSLMAFSAFKDGAAVVTDAGPALDGVRFRRAAFLIGSEALVVLDLLSSGDGAHVLDLVWHPSGSFTQRITGRPMPIPNAPGYRYLKDLRALPMGTQGCVLGYRPKGTPSGKLYWLAIAADAPEASLMRGTAPGTSTGDRRPIVIARQRSRCCTFGSVLTLNPGSKPPRIRFVSLSSADTVGSGIACAAEVTLASGRWLLIANPDRKPMAVGAWSGSEPIMLKRL